MVEARRHMFISGTSLDTLAGVHYPDFTELYGGPWLLAHRVDLHSELRRVATDPKGLGKPVDIILRAEVVDYDSENGSITLANGLIHHADLIVAADGVHSSALRHVTGQETPVMATGWAVFRFLLTVEELRSDPEIAPLLEDGATKIEDGLMKLFTVEGHMRRLVWYPCADNTIQNFVAVHEDRETGDHEREDWHRSASLEDVLSYFGDFHPDVIKIIRKATTITRWPLLYRDPIPTLSKGRLLLIGDAAHPMLPHQGQGGAQAIEDAAALGEVFADLQTNPPRDEIRRRLELFEKIRIKRVSAMQILSLAGQDQAFRVRERAQQYMPDGVSVPTNQPEFWEHNFGYDVIEDSKRQLQSYLKDKSNGASL
ncbi:hypothetical protein ASPVEDRAFT_46683 [Aspergillus versicolor CBS 583.65]|uniref:FAD-binding domain-containing protein n=1 Tax=Aspergillus versicolor CBS 583.65 TaxID=1036611 RepID=A0A1L9Q0N6_ASPVE|nr:uncharacterized protein ASPVEDRAFT_46683 [Aspergillus versicolor CBS 583.65]OJJ07338.1 hypothetical protein ASPVEDRAFT_46683 [Aspergillus versicolor CBS 583.65]